MIVFGRKVTPAVSALVIGLGCLTILCIVSLALHLARVVGPAAALGAFLMDGFSWAGFFVPVYLFACAALLLGRVFRRRSALLLMFSIVPFLTLSLLSHVLSRSSSLLPQALADSFGVVPSALLLFLLLALETIFLFTLPYGMPIARGEAARGPALLPLSVAGRRSRLRSKRWSKPLSWMTPPRRRGRSAAALSVRDARLDKAPAIMITPGPEQEELPFPKQAGASKLYGIPVHHVLKNRDDNEYWIIDDETKRASRHPHRRPEGVQHRRRGDRESARGRSSPSSRSCRLPACSVSKIANLSDNIALRLAAPSVRIVAPIPGRHAVGIEVPNRVRSIVSLQGDDLAGRHAEIRRTRSPSRSARTSSARRR